MNPPKWLALLPIRFAILWGLFLAFGILFTEPLHATQPRTVDDARAQSSGIRKLTSKHLVLYTDLPPSPEIGRLPAVFDKAVPQWAAYLGVDAAKTANWQPRAYLIADRRRFANLDLLPPGHEDFENAITLGAEIWLRDQPTDYYRRHLLLHEGAHAFMIAFLGGCGPGWYMEGTAELLGTHRLDAPSGKLTLGIMPQSREQVPMLGRIKLIQDAVADHRVLSLAAVMKLDNTKQMGSEAYAWCWAAAKFLDSHPRYRDRFRQLPALVLKQNFNDIFHKKFADDWADLNAEWPAYIATLDYGYDFDRMAIDFKPGKRLSAGPQTVTIAADRGWQSTGVRLEAGKSYDVIAKGRYQIAAEQGGGADKPWPCEPGGITIDYHDGKPLGILLGAVDSRDERSPDSSGSFAAPLVIALHATIKPLAAGTLYLRVNDSAAKLGDNRGTLMVTISASP